MLHRVFMQIQVHVAQSEAYRNSRAYGHWFDPQARPIFFRGLMIVIATGFIPLSHLITVLMMHGFVQKQPVAWEEYRAENWF